MNIDKPELITEPLEKALATLKEAWAEFQKNTSNTFIRDSVIQRFEYTFELAHKILRRFLAEAESSRVEISEMFFNDLIRLGCKRGLLLNELETWDKYRKARNLTSHNYDEFNAHHITVIIPIFIEDIEYEIAKIKEKLLQNPVALHIDKDHQRLILSIIQSVTELAGCTVYLYGSRARGTAVKYSDVDIAIDADSKPLPYDVIAKTSSLFEKSLLPYSVDLIDVNTVSPVFKSKIEKDFVKLSE